MTETAPSLRNPIRRQGEMGIDTKGASADISMLSSRVLSH